MDRASLRAELARTISRNCGSADRPTIRSICCLPLRSQYRKKKKLFKS